MSMKAAFGILTLSFLSYFNMKFRTSYFPTLLFSTFLVNPELILSLNFHLISFLINLYASMPTQ